MLALPRSARLVVWAGAWLGGMATLDDVILRVHGEDEPHEVVGVPGQTAPGSLASALAALRAIGVRALRVALPRPGDLHGLAGPPQVNADAVAAGEAVLAVGSPTALIPAVRAFGPPGDQGHLVTWSWRDAAPPSATGSLADAERSLSEVLLAAGSTLAGLDVASWRPEFSRLLDDVRSDRTGEPLPRAFPPAAQNVAARAARILAVVEVALSDDGAAVTGGAARARRDALVPLERAARHALVSACNVLADSTP
ncbi:MAG TPA: hypothetical protein VF082_07875 [Jiangellaceae bacterium]